MPKVKPGHYVMGIAGLATLRTWLNQPEIAEAQVLELARLATQIKTNPAVGFELDISESTVESGYREWSETYDSFPNPLVDVEEGIVRSLIDSIKPGKALDAACGTGRHAKYLQQRGHQVVAVDATSEMLAQARRSIPNVRFEVGRLESLAFADYSFDLVLCALALTHLASLTKPIAELARVLKPGGIAIISDFHPISGFLGGGALFLSKAGLWGNVTSYYHPHSEYIAAFRAAGFEIQECIEPVWGEKEATSGPLSAMAPEAFRTGIIGVPLALIWRLSRL